MLSKEENLKIFVDNGRTHILTERMIPFIGNNRFYFEKPIGCDVQLSFVRIGVNSKLPKVQRIDGIYYDSDTDFNRQNDSISKSHQIADAVIYQSNYSKMLCEKLLSKRRTNKAFVIYNGIDPDYTYEPKSSINIIVLGKHRRHKRLKEIIDVFLAFNSIVNNSFLHIYGLLHDNKPVVNKNIIYYGMVDRKNIDFKSFDMSIHLSKRDSCPNSVVECIGHGIPVITTNNCGGATEMCKMTDGCIIVDGDGDYYSTNPVPHYRDSWNILSKDVFDGIVNAMLTISKNRPRVILPEQLNIRYTTKRYLEALKSVI